MLNLFVVLFILVVALVSLEQILVTSTSIDRECCVSVDK